MLRNFITIIHDKYSTDPILLQDLVVSKKYDYRTVGKHLFKELINLLIKHAETIEDSSERAEFKEGVRNEAINSRRELVGTFSELAIGLHADIMEEEALEVTNHIYSKYFNNPVNTLNTLVKDYLPMHNNNSELAMGQFINDMSSELRGHYYKLDVAKYSGKMRDILTQIYQDFQNRAIRNLIELYGEWAGTPRESTSLPQLTHVPESTTASKTGRLLKNQNLDNPSVQTGNKMTTNTIQAQESTVPAHIVKHDFVHAINVQYVRAPTRDPRTRKRVLDPRTKKASTPYYVFLRVDKIPVNVHPGEASSPQIEIFRYKAPASGLIEAKRFVAAKIKELQRILPNVKQGKTIQSTYPMPFGMISTPELDNPDRPATPTTASFDAPLVAEAGQSNDFPIQHITSIYDQARDLEDVIYDMRNEGEPLANWLEGKISSAANEISEVYDFLINGKKRASLLPRLLKAASELEKLGHAKSAEKLDAIAADIVRVAKEDLLPGGLADGYDEHDFDSEQLSKGLKVEMEHTGDPELALEIAMDHLVEHKNYYKELEKMEADMEEK